MNAHTEFKVPAVQDTLRSTIQEYEARRDGGEITREGPNGEIEVVKKYPGVVVELAEFKSAVSKLELSANVGGHYVGNIWGRYSSGPDPSEKSLRESLLKSAWKHVYKGMNIAHIASAADRKRFEMFFENPPELSMDAIRDTFGDFYLYPRFHVLKGLAECFVDLDPAYKSHDKMKIGVAGLPKRIIIGSVLSEYTPGHGADKLRDVINSLNVVQGDPRIEGKEFSALLDEARWQGRVEHKGLTLKTFANGNGHLIFSKHKLMQVNEALAEFYGDILPDTPDENPKKRTGTAVSKDLQYYPTPRKALDQVFRWFDPRLEPGALVLEPSCGDGGIMDYLLEKEPGLNLLGVEVDPGRAELARAKGHRVFANNFLETTPEPRFDLVFMNPPFYGTHWKKHIAHARKFLKKSDDRRCGGGTLISILPASAYYDGHLKEFGVKTTDRWNENWRDLPVASFASSGTNVPTGIVRLWSDE